MQIRGRWRHCCRRRQSRQGWISRRRTRGGRNLGGDGYLDAILAVRSAHLIAGADCLAADVELPAHLVLGDLIGLRVESNAEVEGQPARPSWRASRIVECHIQLGSIVRRPHYLDCAIVSVADDADKHINGVGEAGPPGGYVTGETVYLLPCSLGVSPKTPARAPGIAEKDAPGGDVETKEDGVAIVKIAD